MIKKKRAAARFFLFLDFIHDCLEGLGVVHRQVGEGLSVQGDTLLLKPADKLRVTHSVKAHAGVDPLYPEGAELSLLVFAVTVRIGKTLLKHVLGNGVNIGVVAKVTLGLLENLLSSCLRCWCICCSWHFSFLFFGCKRLLRSFQLNIPVNNSVA